jgi:Protein of unknown function (DUF2889)
MSWPNGLGTELHLDGRARDLLTPAKGEPVVLALTELHAVTGPQRDIVHIEADPVKPGLERLIGSRAGGNLRASVAAELPEEVAAGSGLYLLLDDLAGSTLIAGFAYLRWADEIPAIRERINHAPRRVMRDICSGFRHGASSLQSDGSISGLRQNTARTGPLADVDDPLGWHTLDLPPEIAMRRARRIDVSNHNGILEIDAMFRDSCWDPDGSEVVVHEYELLATADPMTGTLLSIEARPRVLPYAECPGAAPNAAWMVGTNLRAMRGEVLERLRATDCCTHLNDGLRSLAEVPVLATHLT